MPPCRKEAQVRSFGPDRAFEEQKNKRFKEERSPVAERSEAGVRSTTKDAQTVEHDELTRFASAALTLAGAARAASLPRGLQQATQSSKPSIRTTNSIIRIDGSQLQ